MATTIRDFLIKIGVDADTKTIDSMTSGLKAATAAAAAVVAAITAVSAAVLKLAADTATQGDAAAKGSIRTNTSAEEYQELAFAAEKSAVSISTLETALQKQTAALAELEDGSGTAGEALATLGIGARDSEGNLKSNAQLMEEIAEALANTTDEQERLALAQDIYGSRLAGDLLPLLNEGADGISELREEAVALGGVMSNESAAASAKFNDSLTDLKTIATGLRNVIGEELIPVITEIAEGLRDWFLANQDLIRGEVLSFAEDLVSVVTSLAEAITWVIDLVGGWKNALLGLGAAVTAVLGGGLIAGLTAVIVPVVSALVSAFSFLSSVGLPVILAIGAGIAAMAVQIAWFAAVVSLIVGDLITFAQGGTSVFGEFLERFEGASSLFESMKSLLSAMWSLFEAILPILTVFAELWWLVFSNTTLVILGAIFSAIIKIADVAFSNLAFYIDLVSRGVEGLALLFSSLGAIADSVIGSVMGQIEAATGALSSIAGLVGIDIGGSLAPTSPEGSGGSSTSTSTANVGGTVNNISGAGLSEEQILALLTQFEEDKNLSAVSALEGSEA